MNRKLKLYNMNHDFAAPAEEDKPIFLPFGTWAYNEKIDQTFDREHAEAIASELAEDVAKGEPGIPVYQGHPDVPSLAAKYPDKGALGWVKKMELTNEGVYLSVAWDRFPGKGFAWFSPYWFGEPGGMANGRQRVVVDHIASIGLVNNPNISEFRLPNEAEDTLTPKKDNTMNREELITMLGLPPESTDDQIKAAIAELMKAGEAAAAAEQKAQAAEEGLATAKNECGEKDKACEAAKNECETVRKDLENCRKELEETKTALANEKTEHEKLMKLKTAPVTDGLANEKPATGLSSPRMALVNELRGKGMSFDDAWCAAKKQKPELFKD